MAEQTGKSGNARVLDKGGRLVYDRKSRDGVRGSRARLTDANEIMEHFNGATTIPGGFTATSTTPVAATTYGTGLGGTSVITSDDVAGNVAMLNGPLLWQANRQLAGVPLVFEAKVKFGTLATREFWVGFYDATTDTDPYALSTTSTFTTSVADDACLMGYSATPTSGAAFTSGGNQHVAINTKATVDSVVATGGGVVATATYYTYRIELDATGNAAYYVDGKFVGKKTSAITVTVPLTFALIAAPRATAGSSEAVLTVDYVYIGGI